MYSNWLDDRAQHAIRCDDAGARSMGCSSPCRSGTYLYKRMFCTALRAHGGSSVLRAYSARITKLLRFVTLRSRLLSLGSTDAHENLSLAWLLGSGIVRLVAQDVCLEAMPDGRMRDHLRQFAGRINGSHQRDGELLCMAPHHNHPWCERTDTACGPRRATSGAPTSPRLGWLT